MNVELIGDVPSPEALRALIVGISKMAMKGGEAAAAAILMAAASAVADSDRGAAIAAKLMELAVEQSKTDPAAKEALDKANELTGIDAEKFLAKLKGAPKGSENGRKLVCIDIIAFAEHVGKFGYQLTSANLIAVAGACLTEDKEQELTKLVTPFISKLKEEKNQKPEPPEAFGTGFSRN